MQLEIIVHCVLVIQPVYDIYKMHKTIDKASRNTTTITAPPVILLHIQVVVLLIDRRGTVP